MSLASSDSCVKSDVFSNATKTEIKRLAGNYCWVFHSTDPKVCHVIANEDKQVCDTVAAGSNGIWITMF